MAEKIKKALGEMTRLEATVTGEMSIQDVPVAKWANLDAVKAGDEDPMEVIASVPSGKSTRGWNYTPAALQKIVGEVNAVGLAGFLGHQKEENVGSEFPQPVTHWIGALWKDGVAYFRGVVDKAAGDLKRWIRAGTVRTVSIFGVPTLQTAKGETSVIDYKPLSIDWTPLGRAGMPTTIVAMGEMNEESRGEEMTWEEIKKELMGSGMKPGQVFGEMGGDVKALVKEHGLELDNGSVKAIGEIALVFGLDPNAKVEDVLSAAKTARDVQQKAATADHDKLVDKVIGEMVVAEAARPLVKRMLQAAPDANEETLKTAVGEMLKDEDLKKSLAGVFKDSPITPKTGREDSKTTGLVPHQARI